MNDGGEVDLDLGNYERYLNVTLSRDNNVTTGKIYREVIEKEVCGLSRGFQVGSVMSFYRGEEITWGRRYKYAMTRRPCFDY